MKGVKDKIKKWQEGTLVASNKESVDKISKNVAEFNNNKQLNDQEKSDLYAKIESAYRDLSQSLG